MLQCNHLHSILILEISALSKLCGYVFRGFINRNFLLLHLSPKFEGEAKANALTARLS